MFFIAWPVEQPYIRRNTKQQRSWPGNCCPLSSGKCCKPLWGRNPDRFTRNATQKEIQWSGLTSLNRQAVADTFTSFLCSFCRSLLGGVCSSFSSKRGIRSLLGAGNFCLVATVWGLWIVSRYCLTSGSANVWQLIQSDFQGAFQKPTQRQKFTWVVFIETGNCYVCR